MNSELTLTDLDNLLDRLLSRLIDRCENGDKTALQGLAILLNHAQDAAIAPYVAVEAALYRQTVEGKLYKQGDEGLEQIA